MKANDLVYMCLQNLLRRKSRTLLTMLGVVIGCCSIVIMVSIGIGMNESQQKMLAEMGDLTLITVRQRGSGAGAVRLNASAAAQFRRLEGVILSAPRVELNDVPFQLSAGKDRRYLAQWSTVIGLSQADAGQLGYQLADGSFPQGNGEDAVLVGQFFAYGFADTKRPEGYDMVDMWSAGPDGTPPEPYFDALKTPITLELTVEPGGKKLTQTYQPVGVLREDYSKGDETSQGIIVDIDSLQKLMALLPGKAAKKWTKTLYTTLYWSRSAASGR